MRRLPEGGRIDRSRTLALRWGGEELAAHPGDTLASALLASGRMAVAESVVEGRPRGIVAAAAEEPNAYVQVLAPRPEPLVAATTLPAEDGLEAAPLAGVGRLTGDDSARHDKRHAHCDVLVVGAGRAGAAAARDAASRGARVIICDEDTDPAGDLAPLAGADDVAVLLATAAVGLFDDNLALLVQRLDVERRRVWQVRADEVVVATGAVERPLVVAGNDLPGAMLAGAARAYAERYAVVPERAVVVTTNDAGLEAGRALEAAGVPVAVVDVRSGRLPAAIEGEGRVEAVVVAGPDGGAPERIPCDLVALSGGFDPALDLHRARGGRVRWDAARACFLADGAAPGVRVVGRAAGEGLPAVEPLWLAPGDEARAYVDLQRDVTVADVRRAVGAGLRSIEHVKRYTLIGTGIDQGRTAKTNAAGLVAALLGRDVAEVGTSSSRPPLRPVSFAVLAGRARGPRYDAVRTTPIHPWHVEHGAVFEDVGQWKRPWYSPRLGEDMDAAVLRECRAARESVAIMDASTLGKIDVQGPDAAELLNRLYTNRLDNLAPGRCRYSLMCKVDGMVFDDGVIMRLADDRFLATTTTGNAAAVLDWMEEWLQTEWPSLRVRLTSVTEQWATVAVVGPRARDMLAPLAPGLDLSRDGFRFMAVREAEVAGLPARVARVSFSGELAFEVSVAGYDGLALWRAVHEAGRPYGITPYGTEAMHVLRAEKGYVIVGQDTDGTMTPDDMGLGWMVAPDKEFVGRRSLTRADTARPGRKQLVGLLPHDPAARLPEGAQLVVDADGGAPPIAMVGHVTSSYESAALGRTFALGMVASGRERHGETLLAPLAHGTVAVTVADPVLVDPEGARRDG